ncbi:hypothetical protein, conserved [Trypanosoma brucei gambiense DAL972]|uniref:Uncharacterized protein n=2 Tax=Trypanosoma brucei TaxID=5691 RepID=C9ZYW0_TRYB9|nr:hypothetical protein, conserved [Trypanosoma brucei gambiense DAL972]RHW70107.1 hypothetical protein DPX39_090066900 [Trypanosoma brucei equiperdum]CBH14609.1 hypothetical protein, conserved [Trypanosoma brucei gambiense DAL972]|eukprot:XP_011776875.1 hypothetical protein, conserved [Trypanosoma brucei gambiense DAL972]
MRRQPFPFVARQQYLENGYAILPNALSPSLVGPLREALIASTVARSRYFIDMPDIESMLKSKGKLSDPLYTNVMARLRKRKHILRQYRAEKRQRRRLAEVAAKVLNGRKKEDLSGEELWKLSEALTKEVAKMSGRGCQATIFNDPQMLRAINEYRCNVWMTNKDLQHIVRDRSFAELIGGVATNVGGVDRPVLFSDAPMLREPYGSPFGYHCTAPTIGVKTNSSRTSCVSLLVFTHQPDSQTMPLFVLKGSHRFVKEQYITRISPGDLWMPFIPMETHIPEQLKRFNFDSSVVGVPIEGGDAIGPGTIIAVDPHLMIGMGCNASPSRVVVYRMNVVSEDATPFMGAPSWIVGWRSLRSEVSFSAPVVFPPLHQVTAATS